MGVRSKCCAKYSSAPKNDIEIIPHDYPLNWHEFSGAMEDDLGMALTIDVYKRYSGMIFLEWLVSDDDSTLWYLCTHSDKNAKGKLPENIP